MPIPSPFRKNSTAERTITTYGLIRHAPTQWNERKIIQGQQDSPLSTQGQTMAENWGHVLSSFSWQRIVASDLGRTRTTAELINRSLNLPFHTDKRLREQDWGDWSGRTIADVKEENKAKLKDMVRSGWLFRPPGGESREEVLKRGLAALQEMHAEWPGETILIVCHEGMIKCLLYHLSGRKFLPEEPPLITPAHLHLLEQDHKGIYIKEINSEPLER